MQLTILQASAARVMSQLEYRHKKFKQALRVALKHTWRFLSFVKRQTSPSLPLFFSFDTTFYIVWYLIEIFQRIQSSSDFKFDISGSTEDENRWDFALAYIDQKSIEARKLLWSIKIVKPIQKIDFKLAFDYHVKGPERNASALLRYAQGMK